MIELTYFVLIGAVTVSLTAITCSGFVFRFPIILATVTGHAFFMYQWSWESGMEAETWFISYFLTMIPLVVGLVLCLSRGPRSRATFLALAYCAYLAAFMAVCSMLLSRKDIDLSGDGRLLAIWGVVGAFNFAFAFLVPRRVSLCRQQSSWILPSLAVGLMFVLLVASGLWPVSLVTASGPDLVVFALAALATGVAILALCHPSHDNARRTEDEEKEPKEEKDVGHKKSKSEVKVGNSATCAAEPHKSVQKTPPPLLTTSPTQPTVEPAYGEALYAQARAIPHQPIPDFDMDGPYLELLGKSAEAGYAPALAKFGEYAMRRGAWVEAYYWMTLAKRGGMKNLDASLREIRRAWSMEGFPNQSKNVNALFTLEAGSVGRALLHLDSGHEAAAARQFLREHHPEFLA